MSKSPSHGSSRARRKGAKVADLNSHQIEDMRLWKPLSQVTEAEYDALVNMARRTLEAEAQLTASQSALAVSLRAEREAMKAEREACLACVVKVEAMAKRRFVMLGAFAIPTLLAEIKTAIEARGKAGSDEG